MKAVSNPRWANDPFAALLMPPPDETEDQRAERVHQQAEAARVSREIDESLQEAKKLVEKRKKATKVLLLGKLIPLPRTSRAFITSPGQAESGKSTTLKSEHTPSLLPVILLLMIGAADHRLPALLLSFSIQKGEGSLENRHPAQSHQVTPARSRSLHHSHTLPRSVRTILQVVQDDWDTIGPAKPTSPPPGFSRQNGSIGRSPGSSNQGTDGRGDRDPILTDVHRRLRMRLSPLISMEENLNRRLFPHPPDPKEISVRGGTNWKSYLARVVVKDREQKPSRPRSSQGTVHQEEGTHILVTFKEDIIALWSDPAVHRVLKRRGCNIRDMPGLCVPPSHSRSKSNQRFANLNHRSLFDGAKPVVLLRPPKFPG